MDQSNSHSPRYLSHLNSASSNDGCPLSTAHMLPDLDSSTRPGSCNNFSAVPGALVTTTTRSLFNGEVPRVFVDWSRNFRYRNVDRLRTTSSEEQGLRFRSRRSPLTTFRAPETKNGSDSLRSNLGSRRAFPYSEALVDFTFSSPDL